MRTLYRFLSLWALAKAISRGPGAVARNRAKKAAYKQIGRAL
jgi:hypothetical protein